MAPQSITRPKPYLLQLSWADGFTGTLTLQKFRDECPCAHCKGETILGTTYKTDSFNVMKPGQYELTAINPMGNYAVQAVWKDGHDSGIYTWEYLRALAKEHALSTEEITEWAKKEQN
jgi:DUF971 family protein